MIKVDLVNCDTSESQTEVSFLDLLIFHQTQVCASILDARMEPNQSNCYFN